MNRLQWAIALTGGGIILVLAAAITGPSSIDCVGDCDNDLARFIGELAFAFFLGSTGSVAFLTGAILFIVEAVATKSDPED